MKTKTPIFKVDIRLPGDLVGYAEDVGELIVQLICIIASNYDEFEHYKFWNSWNALTLLADEDLTADPYNGLARDPTHQAWVFDLCPFLILSKEIVLRYIEAHYDWFIHDEIDVIRYNYAEAVITELEQDMTYRLQYKAMTDPDHLISSLINMASLLNVELNV